MAHRAPPPPGSAAIADRIRLRATIHGAVQGVGFRPFVYRLATGLGLAGWVSNGAQGVSLEAEGPAERVHVLLQRIRDEAPRLARIGSVASSLLEPAGYAGFRIALSEGAGAKQALILPDIATCLDCLREVCDPRDRRYRYPFTNCTSCGPRFTIIESLPYDRCRTTMHRFAMCDACRAEFEDPADRRFHAQPNACPRCGPHLTLWRSDGAAVATRDEALRGAAAAVRRGAIVAVKGLGGFHLMVDAGRDDAVRRLRVRKGREAKPLAVMVANVASVRMHCELSEMEEGLLLSPAAPIVLLRRRAGGGGDGAIAPSVAPGNPHVGVMLPSTPFHHLLMMEVGGPVVATSGNLSDEPICTDAPEALERLGGVAEWFLVHDRPIARHVDDSVVRVVAGEEMVLRRARGYAPLPFRLPAPPPCILAVGGHLKNTVAMSIGAEVCVSQHIGDLDTVLAVEAFHRAVRDFERLYEAVPAAVACDAHPDYRSTRFADAQGAPVVRVQHHFAHVVSCMVEHGLAGPVLGIAWDGTGYGPDRTVWGGEFLRATHRGFRRVAHLRRFRLAGGDRAVVEPRRAALGLLYEMLGDAAFALRTAPPLRTFRPDELRVLRTMLQGGLHAPVTSSAGRLFDAVAALLDLYQRVSFEGQAAMALEFALDGIQTDEHYPCALTARPAGEGDAGGAPGGPAGDDGGAVHVVDWEPMVRAILEDMGSGRGVGPIAARFHNGLVEAMAGVARRVGEPQVVLTGGCFQNRYLAERAIRRLSGEGFQVYWHHQIPPGDGGIAVGQAAAAAAMLAAG